MPKGALSSTYCAKYVEEQIKDENFKGSVTSYAAVLRKYSFS